MAENIVRVAKDEWLRRHDGAVLQKTVQLGSPTIKHIYRRSYGQLGRNCHTITIFGRILVGEEAIAPAEEAIMNRLTEVLTAAERRVKTTQAVLEAAGIEDTAEYSKVEDYESPVIVPAQGKFLRVLAMADRYLLLVNTLWLEGEVTEKEKFKAELEIKHLLRGITSTTRKMRNMALNKINAAKAAEAGKEAAGADAAEAGASGIAETEAAAADDASDQAVEATPATAESKPAAKGKSKAKAQEEPEAVAADEAQAAA